MVKLENKEYLFVKKGETICSLLNPLLEDFILSVGLNEKTPIYHWVIFDDVETAIQKEINELCSNITTGPYGVLTFAVGFSSKQDATMFILAC